MSSAMTSLVMSSWVGPRPPQTMTASERSTASASAVRMRAGLSPTFAWYRQSMPASASCSPIQLELVSTTWPNSSSVPIASTSQFISGVSGIVDRLAARGPRPGPRSSRRGGPRRSGGRSQTAASSEVLPAGRQREHHGDAQEPGGDPGLVLGDARASSAAPTASACTSVLSLAPFVAGMARPRRPYWTRSRLTASSRIPIRATGTHQKRSMATSMAMAPKIRTLSASGSRKAPDRVVPWRRAIQPSTPSVAARNTQRANVDHDAPSREISAKSTGDTRRRVTVTAFAGVRRADGP